jgi:hypothetical protein
MSWWLAYRNFCGRLRMVRIAYDGVYELVMPVKVFLA